MAFIKYKYCTDIHLVQLRFISFQNHLRFMSLFTKTFNRHDYNVSISSNSNVPIWTSVPFSWLVDCLALYINGITREHPCWIARATLIPEHVICKLKYTGGPSDCVGTATFVPDTDKSQNMTGI